MYVMRITVINLRLLLLVITPIMLSPLFCQASTLRVLDAIAKYDGVVQKMKTEFATVRLGMIPQKELFSGTELKGIVLAKELGSHFPQKTKVALTNAEPLSVLARRPSTLQCSRIYAKRIRRRINYAAFYNRDYSACNDEDQTTGAMTLVKVFVGRRGVKSFLFKSQKNSFPS